MTDRSMDSARGLSLGLAIALALAASRGPAQEAEPPLEKLIELNALFGAPASLSGGRVTLTFPGKGAFAKAFSTKGARGLGFLSDEKEAAGMRALLLEGAKGQFSVVGRDSGLAVLNFPLVGDVRIAFRLRSPSMPSNAKFDVFLHQEDSRNYVQVAGLREVVHVERGKRRAQAAKERPYSQPLATWFDRKSPGVPFEIALRGGKLTVSMTIETEKAGEKEKRVEIASLEEIRKPDRGKIAFDFANVSFLLSDLVIEGGWDRGWAEKEIAALRKAGKLRKGEPEVAKAKPAEAGKPGGAAARGGQGSAEPFLPPRREVKPVDIKSPDPKSGEEL